MGHFAKSMEKLHFLPPQSIWWLLHHPLLAAANRPQSRFCRTSDLFIAYIQTPLISAHCQFGSDIQPGIQRSLKSISSTIFIFSNCKQIVFQKIICSNMGSFCHFVERYCEGRQKYDNWNISSRTKVS